jgi:hypothetical protein
MPQRLRLRERPLELLFLRVPPRRLPPRRLVPPLRLVRPPLDRLLPLRLPADERPEDREDDRDADERVDLAEPPRDDPDRADFAREAEDRPRFAADFLAEPPLRDLAATFLRPEPLLSPPRCSYPSSLFRARFCFAV